MVAQGPGISIYKVAQTLDRLLGFQEFEAPKFQEIWHVNVVRFSVLTHQAPLTPGNIPCTHCR